MKNVVILHGSGETPESFWIPYVRKNLEELGYRVSVPQLPQTDDPVLELSLSAALLESYDSETILIGHSSGCPLILSVLERLEKPVRQAVLVAGFISALDDSQEKHPMVQENYNWEKIRQNCEKFVTINSDNDPWGCDDAQGRAIFEHVGGTLVILHGEGHMGSDRYNQPYKEFPLLVKLVD